PERRERSERAEVAGGVAGRDLWSGAGAGGWDRRPERTELRPRTSPEEEENGETPAQGRDKVKDVSVKKDMPYKVFFKDLFLFKENEMEAKKKEKFINRSMKVYQKSTFSSRMKSRSHLSQLSFYSDKGGASFDKYGLDPTLILRLTEGSDSKRTVHEFINDQRDRFLLEYALSTKRNKIEKFERLIALKERQLMKAEKKLQEDAMAFEEFLRENDQRSADALKMTEYNIRQMNKSLLLFSAAQETINKLQVTTELKKASMEVQAVKSSEITKTEFLLREYMKFGLFLLKLSPKHWQMQQALKRVQASKNKETMNAIFAKKSKISAKIKENHEGTMKTQAEDFAVGKGSQGGNTRDGNAESISSEDSLEFFLDDDTAYDLEPELYFKEPEELLQVLNELEEQNLTLVQYSQDVDENLEDVNKREKLIQDKINSNIDFLLEHKKVLKANCVREEEKAAELELRSRLFSFGEFNSDAQVIILCGNFPLAPDDNNVHILYTKLCIGEKLIDSLSRKINQVYRICIGDAEVGSLNPVQKLVKVESRLVELSDLIESIPKENVEAIERIKHKERRQKLREEKLKEKQRHQEERLKVALQRAVAQPKKKLGRRLIYRSQPPSANKHELLLVKDTKTKTLEDEYFFT
ncbi:Coiled-coil domain-containing protein 38, partial [Galemys pyrenaicus]